jgi:endonuclease/exonuclease/phosphatase (EEP) superfamily protein YafD
MLTALVIATCIMALLTALPLTRIESWWVRVWDFPRVQITAYGVLVVVAILAGLPWIAWSTWTLAGISAACVAYQLVWIVPYTRLFPFEVERAHTNDDARTLRLMSANVLGTNRSAGALLRLVREHDPDVLVTLESNAWWESQLDTLEPIYPYAVKCALDNLYGMHLYSKLPLSEACIDYLVEDDKPSIHCLIHLRSGDLVRAHFLHPAPPGPTENETSGERDAELLVVARAVREVDEPVIVAGDLNDVAWSETTRAFRRISRLLDPRRGRGMFNTFHARFWFLRIPLDHLFHSAHFRLRDLRRSTPFGSDHFALVAQLVFEPGSASEQKAPDATERDLDLAERKERDESVAPDDVPAPGE